MKININKSIEQSYKNEIWKGFTLREVGCAAGALITIGAVAFLSYRLLHLSLTIGVYIGIPFAFPFILLGFKKFSGMTLLQYLKVWKARRDAGLLMKTDNLPDNLPRAPFRMAKDLSYGETLGYQYGFDKKTWRQVRRKELLYRLTHKKKKSFREFQYDDPKQRPLGVEIPEDVPPVSTSADTRPRDHTRPHLFMYPLLACIVLTIGGFAYLYVKGIIRFPLPGKEAQEITTAEVTTKEPTTVSIQSSDASLKVLKIDEASLATDQETQEYEVAYSVAKVTISAEPNDDRAAISGSGAYDLKTGMNKITLQVEAEDGTQKTYTLHVIRKEEETTQQPTQAPTQPAVNYNYNNNNYYVPPAPPQQPTVAPNDGVTIIG